MLQFNASRYIPVDADLLPDGEVRPVQNTPHDFRAGKAIGRDNSRVLNFGAGRAAAGSAGYDDIWVLDGAGMRVGGTTPTALTTISRNVHQPDLPVASLIVAADEIEGKGNQVLRSSYHRWDVS